jgi:hypothetical protein
MDSEGKDFPSDRELDIPHRRAWNIAFRTAHLAPTGVLLGGHVFDVAETRLRLALHLSIGTGLSLAVIEAYPGSRWFTQGRGAMVLTKLALLCMIPFFWAYRVPILLAVVFLASVGSHMPSRFRYYSFVHRRVLEHRSGRMAIGEGLPSRARNEGRTSVQASNGQAAQPDCSSGCSGRVGLSTASTPRRRHSSGTHAASAPARGS